MKKRSKRTLILIAFVFMIITVILLFTLIRQKTHLHSLESKVANISLPQNIEKIAIKSAIGDSGGNGDYSTFRVILVVKTKLNINELKSTIEGMNLRFPGHYIDSKNNPTQFIYITHCESSTFHSSREFMISFTELNDLIDYGDYYFIEFVE